ncbi:MAG TPA: tetratricopeptide repeat protein [Phycisphaerae bacterium]|nr:tetratricopeptide repeat protein [Phycisphaerae bacterium]
MRPIRRRNALPCSVSARPIRPSEHYRQAIEIRPNDLDTYFQLAVLFDRNGDSQSAAACLPKVLSLAEERGDRAPADRIRNMLNPPGRSSR